MTKDEAVKRLSVYIVCLKCEISGKECDDNCRYQYEAGTMGEIVEALETLIRAEPQIIRCKDCKHYQFADNRAFGFSVKRCEWTGFEDVDDDDFCSRGERMDSEQILSEVDSDTAYGGLMSAT